MLLLLFDLFLRKILSVFPVDAAANDFTWLFSIVLYFDSVGELVVGEEVIFFESELDFDGLWVFGLLSLDVFDVV